MANDIVNYQDVITDIKGIISSGREVAYNAANKAMVRTYWHVGKRIVEQEQAGKERAKYGQALIEALADELIKEYGKSFSKRNLQYFRKFYLAFPDEQIVNACVHNLNWTHFRALLRVPDENITHQDVGQIDMYVRMYDELKCKEGDNPTLGILLCAETDEDIARYSVLHDNDRLFMSKYLTYLPTKEQLKAEIERQKEIFYMQHPALSENDKEGMEE